MNSNTISVEKKKKIGNIGLLLGLLIFYLFFAIYDGPVICVDTNSYVTMSVMREWLYPTFLAINRMIFGEDVYLAVVVILQSILIAYVTWNVTVYIRDRFHLEWVYTALIVLIQLATSLLNRFAAGRGSMYSNSILTEGITIPLYILLLRYAFEYIVDGSRRSMIWMIALTFVLISTRKQMYISLLILAIAIIWQSLRVHKSWLRSLGLSILLVAVIFAGMTLCDHTYNLIVHGRFVGHTSDNRFVMTMMIYTSDEDYVQYVPEEYQALYSDIYAESDAAGYLMHSASKGWLNRVEHFGDYYDLIQEVIIQKTQEYAIDHYTDELTDRSVIADEVCDAMIDALAIHCAPRVLRVLMDNFLSGLVTTVAVRRQILIQYSIIFYVVYIALFIYLWQKKRQLRFTQIGGLLELSAITMISTVLNVGLVSLVIFTQTRYTIYNMALIYISMLLMLRALWQMKRDNSNVQARN